MCFVKPAWLKGFWNGNTGYFLCLLDHGGLSPLGAQSSCLTWDPTTSWLMVMSDIRHVDQWGFITSKHPCVCSKSSHEPVGNGSFMGMNPLGVRMKGASIILSGSSLWGAEACESDSSVWSHSYQMPHRTKSTLLVVFLLPCWLLPSWCRSVEQIPAASETLASQ